MSRPHTHARGETTRTASIDLDEVLDKEWTDKSLPEILAAPVGALKGVSDRDGEFL